MNRRDVLSMALASAGLAGAAARTLGADQKRPELPDATPRKLPYWRGFNLPVAYRGGRRQLFDERDFADVAELGFNFLRLALNYHDWTDPDDPKRLKEPVLKQIDRAVEQGKQHGIHLLLDFHIAPGFGQIVPPERTNLWTEREPAELCAYQWSVFAERYKGVPNSRLSFNLFNEPDDKVKPEDFRRVTEQLVKAVRAKDPDRLIIVDGRNWARTPITELLGLGVAADIHSYDPIPLTHYKAAWVHWNASWPEPASSNLEVVVPVKPRTRYRVGIWIRREKVGVCGAYCSERDDQNKLTGKQGQVGGDIPRQDGAWLPVSWEITTEPKTTRLSLRADIYRSTGTLRLDDYFIEEVNEGVYEPVEGRTTVSGNIAAITASLPQRGLELQASLRADTECLRVDGVLKDATGRDRAVAVRFGLPPG